MPRNRFIVLSTIIITAAWIIGIPGIYLYYDVWGPYDKSLIMRQAALQPYAIWLGTIPIILFWVGCIVGTVVGNRGLKQIREGSKLESGESLGKVYTLFGGIGVLIGWVICPLILVKVLYYILLQFGGDPPIGH